MVSFSTTLLKLRSRLNLRSRLLKSRRRRTIPSEQQLPEIMSPPPPIILTDLILAQKSTRTTPIALITSPEAVTDRITLSDLENASNRAASFLEAHLPPQNEAATFFYMGPSDIRYFIWILAAMKTERCVMLPSPGNTIAANQRLFETVGAKTLLYAPEAEQTLAALLDASRGELRHVVTPVYAELMSRDPAPTVHALNKPFEEVKDKAVVGLHTSGTSGHPKPIYWTHGSINALGCHTYESGIYPEHFKAEGLETLFQAVLKPGEVVTMPFPMYHMAGVCSIILPILYGSTNVLPATGTKLTSENITGILRCSKSDTAWLAPSILEEMLDYPLGLQTLGEMKHVLFGGGPMNPSKGAQLALATRHLCSIIGSTEGGSCHLLSPADSTHWNAFHFAAVGQQMQQVEPGLFELVYPNTPQTRAAQLYFHSYPHLTEYRTKDLFAPVPGKPDWWTYRGRTDNWVVMANALKMDPTAIEDAVGAHPAVRGVLVAGERRSRLCLLVELKDNEASPANAAEREAVLNKLWPYVEDANKSSPKFGRIPRELIFLAARDKPFLRASKGTIQRRLTIENLADEINTMYANFEGGLLTLGVPPLESLSAEAIAKLLQYLYADVLELPRDGAGIGVDEDILGAGVDSFGMMTISSRLKGALRQYGVEGARLDAVSVKNLYAASTIASLAKTLETALASPSEGAGAENGVKDNTSADDVLALIQKYRAEVEALVAKTPFNDQTATNTEGQPASETAGHTVLLTGSTGSLGTYLLAALLARPDIKKVICLNRGHDAEERQSKSFESRNFPPVLQDPTNKSRVAFHQADLQSPRLGLSPDAYASIARETTVIIHNAYPVNFLMNVHQFEPHLLGLLRLIELSLQTNAYLMFVSSISTGMSATGARQRVPEIVLDTATQLNDLLPQGYAQSKYVCEQMLQTLADRLASQHAAVLRVGQICGPRHGNGAWNKWEWFPSLVMSSRFLGVAPDAIGQKINWVPVDELATILTELVADVRPSPAVRAVVGNGEKKSPGLEVYNLVNPSLSSWSEVLPALTEAVPETVPVSRWVARLEASVETSTHLLDQNPGAKLVDFYKGAFLGTDVAEPVYDVENLVRASSTAAKLSPVTQSDLKRWMDAWV